MKQTFIATVLWLSLLCKNVVFLQAGSHNNAFLEQDFEALEENLPSIVSTGNREQIDEYTNMLGNYWWKDSCCNCTYKF